MKTLQQKYLDQLFASLQGESCKDKEAADVWFVKAGICVSLALGNESPFRALLEEQKKSAAADNAEEPRKSVERAKEILLAARDVAAALGRSAEDDSDLSKLAESAIQQAAIRSGWLKIGASILGLSAVFLMLGTLRINSFSADLEKRIQDTMKEKRTALDNAAAAAAASLDQVQKTKQTELSNRAAELMARVEKSMVQTESNQTNLILQAGSEQIAKLRGDKGPDILTMAQTLTDRLDRADRRQSTIEAKLSGLEGLSARLDRTTITQLKELVPKYPWLRWVTAAAAALALIVGARCYWILWARPTPR